MKTHRGLFLSLGLLALLGVSAREVKAETMQLTVLLNGTQIYDTLGGPTGVAATGALNTALLGTGYSFTNLGGSSNFTGSTGDTFAFVADSGTLTRSGGTGGELTIIVTEGGWMSPTSSTATMFQTNQGATFSGATGGSNKTYVGSLNGISQGTTPPTLFGTTSVAQSATMTTPLAPGAYSIPFTLTNTTTMTLDQASSGSKASNVFTGTTSITGAVPEPASLIMMVAGMPLPLVVMGLLRRRRAAA